MRCSKCGSFIDDHENVCPVCGTVVDASEKSEVIQAEIGNKIDMFLNDKEENLKNIRDGVDIKDGHMEVAKGKDVSDTIKMGEADNESIFKIHTVTAGRQQVGSDGKSIDSLGEIEEEPVGLIDSEEAYDDETIEDVIEGKRSVMSPGLIAAIAAGAVLLIALIVVLVSGVGRNIFGPGETESETETETEAETETVPEDVIGFSIDDGGSYSTPLTITITSERKGSIYYTTDGTEPTKYSKRYTGSVKIADKDIDGEEQEMTLRVITLDPSGEIMGSSSIRFTVKLSEVEAPEFSLDSGSYSSVQTITIKAQDGAKIYYTYDGSTPTESSNVYSEGIAMKRGNNILSAIAVKDGRTSEVSQAVYDLEIEPAIFYEWAQELLSRYLAEKGYLPESEIPEETEPETEKEPESESKGSEDSKETSEAETPKEPETEKEPETPAAPEEEHEYFEILNAGTTLIGNDQYYVFEVDHLTAQRDTTSFEYYGVDDQQGNIVSLTRDGYSYYISD